MPDSTRLHTDVLPGTLTADRPAVAGVHHQDDQLVIVNCVQDPVVTGNPDPQPPCIPVSIFAPAGLGPSRSDSVAAMRRSATGRSGLRSARTASGAYRPEVTS